MVHHGPKTRTFGELLIHHSTRLQAGEHVLIEAFDIPESMVIAAVKRPNPLGRILITLRNNRLQRALIENAPVLKLRPKPSTTASAWRKWMRAGLRGGNNANELGVFQGEDQALEYGVPDPSAFSAACEPHPLVRVAIQPAPGMARSASRLSESYEDFSSAFAAMDCPAWPEAVEPLKARMDAADGYTFVVLARPT